MTALSALVDELMGKDRNAGPNEKRSEIRWDTDEVCKHFLCGFCPAELFTNTRSDLGICNKSHDERAKEAYESSQRYMKVGYEEEFLRYLQQCWQDVERRIRRNHQRLQLSEEKAKQAGGGSSESDEKMNELNDRITKMLEDIEDLGSKGEVDQAQAMMKVCDQLKEEREQLQTSKGGIMDQFAVQEKQMEVCEVCGAFLIVGDAQSRVDDHLMGKQHMGYAKIKAAITELKDKLTLGPIRNQQRATSPLNRNDDVRRRSRDRSSRDVEGSRSRGERSSRHHRSRSRDRHSRRDTSSSRHRRSTSRERKSSSRRDRSSRDDRHHHRSSSGRHGDVESRRKRSGDRRDRSRSRDKKKSRRSRSKERRSSSSSSKHASEESRRKSSAAPKQATIVEEEESIGNGDTKSPHAKEEDKSFGVKKEEKANEAATNKEEKEEN